MTRIVGLSALLVALACLPASRTFAADAPPAPPTVLAPAEPAAPSPAAAQPPATNATAPAVAPVASLMFTPQEVQAIDKAFADHLHPPAEQVAAQVNAAALQQAQIEAARPRVPNIYVSAVLDFGGGEWTVWANGLKLTPTHQSPLFHVVSVSGNTVEIVPIAQPSTHIRLQPYQTWRARQGDVVEGIIP